MKKAAYSRDLEWFRTANVADGVRPMRDDTTHNFPLPVESSSDVLTAILRQGSQRLLSQAIDAEVESWIAAHAHVLDQAGHRQVVRNGHMPPRTILTGIGAIE